MRNILRKEIKLSASVLSFLFIAFGLMFFLPGYPVLCSVFFVTLGLFQSFQSYRESNDIIFSALLPIGKKDVVRGKYLFVCFIELVSVLVMLVPLLLRMTVLYDSPVYRSNALMNANLFALGMAFVLFGLFNWIFVGGFFKTAYKFARPFVTYIVVCFLVIILAEALHHFPGLSALNAFGTDHLGLQILLLAGGICAFLLMTCISMRKACRDFDKIDL
ncbi:MAG: ABC-2 transporter permease [Erysipelotrichales bacterium]|nr:ABC-2 transporter permease [Erysipelotrichales bacterium]